MKSFHNASVFPEYKPCLGILQIQFGAWTVNRQHPCFWERKKILSIFHADEGNSTSIVSGNPCWIYVPRQSLKPMTLKPKPMTLATLLHLPTSLPFKVRTQSLLFWTSPFQVFGHWAFPIRRNSLANTHRFVWSVCLQLCQMQQWNAAH